MLLTEDESKTKWCPFARYSNGGLDGASNRWTGALANEAHARVNPDPCRCLGSACMAWRWGDTPRETVRNYHDAPTVGMSWDAGARRYHDGWQYHGTATDQDGRKFDLLYRIAADDAPKHGYCGLAGKAVA